MSDLLDRLSAKFLVGDGCWPWTGALDSNGYGQLRLSRARLAGAHRVVYEALVGPIPAGLQLDHLCRNRGCVRPDHLEPVTSRENTRRGAYATKTHCSSGHEFTDENTYRYSDGRRKCRACRREQMRRYKEEHSK